MNRENILRVAAEIEHAAKPRSRPKLGFNMQAVFMQTSETFPDKTGHDCKTAACIKGWVITLFPKVEANEALGLTERQSKALFLPRSKTGDHWFRDASPAEAVATLRRLARTGKVQWPKAAPS